MIQISPHLIRNNRRVSFDENELKTKGSAVERLMSSSPDRLDENPLAEMEEKILEEKRQLERERGKSEAIPVPAGDSPGGEDLQAGGEGQKPEGKTKTVKFGISKQSGKGMIPSSAPTPSVFTKEVVEKKKSDLPFSLITKGLLDSGVLQQQRGGGGKTPRPLSQNLIKVFVEVGRPGIKIPVTELAKVIDVIEMVLEKHNGENKEPQLPPPASNYELRMLEEDDGSADYDMAPLENSREIIKYGVAAVALVKKGSGQGDVSERMKINIEPDGPVQDEKSARFFVRMHTEDKVSYVLKSTRETPLRDLIPLLAKKKLEADEMRPELYNIVYMKTPEMEPLDMNMKVGELESDNLMLLSKVRSVGISPSLLQAAPAGGPSHQFIFTKDTAMAYSEYRVIKTNRLGKKQPRIIGLDANNVYNKHLPSNKAKRRVSFDKVAHPFRPLHTVVECEIAKDDPQSFTIVFKDPATGTLKALHYQTETKMEAAEIVAKVQFLRMNPSKQSS